MSEYIKVIHDVFPETEIVELSEYKEEKNDSYEHYSVLREATEAEIPREASPGPNVQSFEENNESSELSTMKNENDDVIVELSKSEENNRNDGKGVIEVSDPYSERAEKFFDSEELSRIRSAHDEEQSAKSVEGKSSQDVISEIESEFKELQAQKRKEKQREEVREKVEEWDSVYGKKVEEMTASEFSELMADSQEGRTLEDRLDEKTESLLEEESENEEELSEEVDPETAKEAVEAWGSDRYSNTVFESFAETLEEDIEGEEVEELEENTERDSTPVETHVQKHGNGNATVESNDPQIKSELRDVEFAEILNESGDMVEAKVTDYKKNMGE